MSESLQKRFYSRPGMRPTEDGVEAVVASFEIDAYESEEEVFQEWFGELFVRLGRRVGRFFGCSYSTPVDT